MKIIPRSSGSRSRNISPCSRVGSSAATSTCTVKWSGRVTRGPDCAAGAVAADGGDALRCVQAAMIRTTIRTTISTAIRTNLLLTLDLHLARDEIVLLRVIPERTERHV